MKTIADILKGSDTPLAKLITKAKSSQDLEVIFHTALEPVLANHCHVANYKDSNLVVTVTNASIATRLRYAIPDIIKQLQIQPEFKNLKNIRYTIISPPTKPKPQGRPVKISSTNESLLKKTISDLHKK